MSKNILFSSAKSMNSPPNLQTTCTYTWDNNRRSSVVTTKFNAKINYGVKCGYFPCTMAQCLRIIPLSLWKKMGHVQFAQRRPTAIQIIYDPIFYLKTATSPHPWLSSCLVLVHVLSAKAALLRHSLERASPFSLWATTCSALPAERLKAQGGPVWRSVSSKTIVSSDCTSRCSPSSWDGQSLMDKTTKALCPQRRNTSSSTATYWRHSDWSQRSYSQASYVTWSVSNGKWTELKRHFQHLHQSPKPFTLACHSPMQTFIHGFCLARCC